MAGYIGSKSSVTLVDGYTEAEADAEFVNDPNGAITVSGSNVGIGTSSPEGKLHVYSDNVGTPSADADDFIIEKTGDTGLSILSTSTGRIYFGDTASNDQGSIRYVHGDNSMRFETDSAERMRIDSSGATFRGNGDAILLLNTASDAGDKSLIRFGDNNDADAGYIDYDHGTNSLAFGVNAAERMRIDSTGAVTIPLQPAFFATSNTNQNNIANNNSSVHVLLQTEIFDNNSDFASSTFTAPVTGKYMLSYSLCLLNMDSAADYYIPQIKTSNRDINSLYDPGQLNGDPNYQTFTMSVLTDMDANDTATVRIIQNGGAAQTDVEASSLRTYFSGFLVC